MISPLRTLPLPPPGQRVTVVIPARNESALIGKALAALSAQRDLTGLPLAPGLFDVIVFANNCSDATAEIVRAHAAAARHLPIFVVERDLRKADSHVGAARKFVMDLAAQRFLSAGQPAGIIASTDSDTVVDPTWLAWTLREFAGADAVAGHVTIAQTDQQRLLAPVRLLYAREITYRRLVAEVEALIDPVPEDPLPRHSSFVGASFAVTAQTYVAAGKLPPLRRLEDLHFFYALRRIDARIRHSPFVRASTSARTCARVDGGFGAFMASLHECAGHGAGFHVEHPLHTLDELEFRSTLRAVWLSASLDIDSHDLPPVLRAHPHWPSLRASAGTFGAFHERVAALRPNVKRPEVSVEVAIDVLRATVQRQISGVPAALAGGASNLERGARALKI